MIKMEERGGTALRKTVAFLRLFEHLLGNCGFTGGSNVLLRFLHQAAQRLFQTPASGLYGFV